jgi:hypothetical protein
MGIVVSDDMPPEVTQEARDKAEEMRALLDADLEEHEIAARVRSFDGGDLETQLGSWFCLTTRERRAWRDYRGMRLHQD